MEAAYEHSASRPTALDIAAEHDLRGKYALVTGGAAGIGVECVRALAARGAKVIIATRKHAFAENVAASIPSLAPELAVEAVPLDLTLPLSVHYAADQVLARVPKLDFLFNNAGIMATPLGYTSDGVEMQFASNFLGHFLLTRRLLPALRAAGKARVITLTSVAHRRSDIHYDDIHFKKRPYEPWSAYGQSTTATALFAVGLTERHQAEGVVANAVMPGGIMTGLQRHVPRERQIELGWISETGEVSPVFKTPEQGAATSLWAALTPELEGKGGLYLQNCAISTPWRPEQPLLGYMPYALSPRNATRLWQVAEAMLGL